MRIGIDARAAAEERGGRGTMVRELLLALDRSDARHTYVLAAHERWDAPLSGRFQWRLSSRREPFWHVEAGLSSSRWCDVYLSSNSYLTAWFTRVPTVVVVCDMVAFDRDLAPRLRSRLIERATLPLSIRRAAALTAISKSTALELERRFPAAGPKTSVTLLAAGSRFSEPPETRPEEVARNHGIDRPYVVAVGTLEPRKNLVRLMEAYAGLPAQLREGHRLVLVGATGWSASETLAMAERLGPSMMRLGHVSDSDLVALYQGAALFAYPSLHEGFGLPILEAMASGTAVLTSNVSSMPEVAGDAAIYCDPRDTSSIRAALLSGLTDAALRSKLEAAARARAAEFSWDRHAREVLQIVQRAGSST